MTEPETVEVDAHDDDFRDAVREAVRPIVRGLYVLIGVVTLAGGITIGALAVQASGIIQTRNEGRTSTCGDAQYFELHHNALAGTNQAVTEKVYGDFAKRLPPDQMTAVKEYADTLSTEFQQTKVPVRGCSTDAIKAYIRWRKLHPDAVPCATDVRGFCKTPPTLGL